jgi:hypothetical protein
MHWQNPSSGPRSKPSLLALVGLSVGLVACGQDLLDPAEDPEGLLERIGTLGQDLGPGSQGEEVRILHAYLMAYGYLPNQALRREYPAWRPVVAEAPERLDRYDASTEAAVRAVQRQNSLTPTGTVDAATRTALRRPRCGMPEGDASHDPRDKFALWDDQWPVRHLTWRYLPPDPPVPGVSDADAIAALNQAFTKWLLHTNFTFGRVPASDTTAKITFQFVYRQAKPGQAFYPPNPNNDRVNLSRDFTWSTAFSTPAGATDFQSLVTHEIGHTLGLRHTDLDDQVMFHALDSGTNRRDLGTEDIHAITIYNNPWSPVPGCVKDLAVGNDQSVWVIGCDDVVQKWNGSGWTSTPQTGSAIAVHNSGAPWVVALNGAVKYRNSNGSWGTVAGSCARDIGASTEVWMAACGPYDGYVHRLGSGGTFVQDALGYSAMRIAVQQDGRPWIVRSDGTVYQRSTNSVTDGYYARIGDDWYFGPNADVAVSGSGFRVQAWVTDTNINASDTWTWNEQTGNLADRKDIHWPFRFTWIRKPGHANRIATGPNNPWIATVPGAISSLTYHPL